MTLKASSGDIQFYTLNSIHFGQKAKDINLCDSSTQFYQKVGDLPDLSGNNATFNVSSMTPGALRDLTVSMSLLKEGALNIRYTYANMTGVTKAPFEVPAEIIDVDRKALHPTGKLSDYVT